ncbi:MAG: GGDEF domain-containing protein [Proteobacteria bacterium]|nr:GGDEF domain-containing protein [Pseudomonadota bacterium]
MRFPDAGLERQFTGSYRAAARPWVRISILVALCTTLGFAVIDHWLLVGPRLAHPDLWRFGLQIPLILIMTVLTSPRLYARWYSPAIQIAAPLFGVGTVLMAVEATPAQLPLIAARLVLAAFFFYFMLGLSFGAALRTNAALIAAYAIAALSGAIAFPVAVYSLFVLLCANVIGAAGCYALEHANRVAFLERQRLKEMASRDALTGLSNRAALEEQAQALWQQARISGEPVSVLLIDIDYFKAYNDRYGHLAGDYCLRVVAPVIHAAATRHARDIVARYGGEEIIAVLSGCDRATASAAAATVVAAVKALNIEHLASQAGSCLTVSVGAATLSAADGHGQEQAVRLADIALYAAKARGRDGWMAYDPPAAGPGAETTFEADAAAAAEAAAAAGAGQRLSA